MNDGRDGDLLQRRTPIGCCSKPPVMLLLSGSAETKAAGATLSHDPLAAVYAEEWPRCVAILTRVLGDLERAEDAVQDAFCDCARALAPRTGLPDNPGAWIVTTARNAPSTGSAVTTCSPTRPRCSPGSSPCPRTRTEVSALPDDRLALLFTCCHPALATDVQIALTLREVGGLTTPEIAGRIPGTRSRRWRSDSCVRSARSDGRDPVPRSHRRDAAGPAGPPRSACIYLVFNEGYAANAGGPLVRRDLSSEAIRLAKLLCVLMPDEPEAFGLLALMLLQDSRRDARLSRGRRAGAPRRPGSDALGREGDRRGPTDARRARESLRRPGPYQLQAAIAAGHAQGSDAGDARRPPTKCSCASTARRW